MSKSYRELQDELNEILDRFEHSTHDDVDELVVDYEKGIALIAQLEERLKQAEKKVRENTSK